MLFQGTLFPCLQLSTEVVFTLLHVILCIEAFWEMSLLLQISRESLARRYEVVENF